MLARYVLTLMNGHHEGPPAHESFTPTMTHLHVTGQRTIIMTTSGDASSEARRLPVHAPEVAQGVADLAERGLCPNRIEHRGNHVLRGPGDLDQMADGSAHYCLVTSSPSRGQRLHLFQLDLMADTQNLQLMADRLGVAVDADHLLLGLLKGDLVCESRVRDL